MDEMYYYAFCIAYDLKNKYYQESASPECDVVFEECKILSKEFMKSEEYKNTHYTGYEMLEEWLKNNEEKIKELHTGENPFKKENKKEREVR